MEANITHDLILLISWPNLASVSNNLAAHLNIYCSVKTIPQLMRLIQSKEQGHFVTKTTPACIVVHHPLKNID